jgi:hypothetical protein
MSDKEKLAKDAQQLLENPLLAEALELIEKEAINAWIGTGLGDEQDRERHWMMVKSARRLKEYLKGVVEDQRFEASRAVRAPLP